MTELDIKIERAEGRGELKLFIRDFGPDGCHGRVCPGPDGEEVPARFAVIILSGRFPGRVLANPRGGNCYYPSLQKAEEAREGIFTNWREGRAI